MNSVDRVLHRSLDLSCPEAARLVLLDPQRIEFDEQPYIEGSIRPGYIPALDTSSFGESPEPYRFFRAVQRSVIALLQNRAYPIWKRLFLLGCLCEKLDEMGGCMRDANALGVLQTYVDSLTGGSLDDLVAQHSVDLRPQLSIVLELIVARISSDANPQRFLECYREFMSGLEWTSKSTMDELAARYAASYSQHYLSFTSRHEHILEHYLVNYAFRTLFPYGLPESNRRLQHARVASPIVARYMLMTAHYAITRTLLIGIAAFHKSAFGAEQVIKLIQSSTKTFEHSLAYPGQAIELLAGKNMTTAADLCVLIQN